MAKPYVHQEYPKMKYHKDRDPKIVKSKAHEASLGDEWVESPKVAKGVETYPAVESFEDPSDEDSSEAEYEDEGPVRRRGRPKKDA